MLRDIRSLLVKYLHAGTEFVRSLFAESLESIGRAEWRLRSSGTHDSIEFRRIVISSKGYGRSTVEAVIELAFEARGAYRLWLDVKDDNVRARNLYESLGFQTEGRLRECYKVGDRYESLIVMSMLSREYLAVTD